MAKPARDLGLPRSERKRELIDDASTGLPSSSCVLRQALRERLAALVSLDEQSWERVLGAFRTRDVARGGIVCHGGTVCTTVSFLVRGLLRSSFVGEARASTCDLWQEGEFATDYLSFLSGEPSTVDIVALTPSTLLVLTKTSLERLYDDVPGVDRLGRLIAERQFVAAATRTSGFLRATPEQRYRKLVEERPGLAERVPQYLLASYLGVTPESLSRIRQRLVSRRRQRIATDVRTVPPGKSKAPLSKPGGPKVPRASREKP
jgi:CRP/FNR family transcriptional regulator, anaerobic regulatory protein